MPQRHFHFRPPPGVPQSENVVPAALSPLEPVELLKQLGLEDDDPFGESPGVPERSAPAPRMRMSAAAATAAASAVQHGGNSAKNNPFLDKVSIKDWDINPHRIMHDLKHQ